MSTPLVSDDVKQHIDHDALKQLQNILNDEFWLLFTKFKESASLAMNKLEKAAKKGDVTTIKAAAHELKGMAMNMYALELVRLCRFLEDNALSLSYTETMNSLSELRVEVLTVIAEIARLKI